jgi:uncharacterized phiE125 gp8 family phage protein
MIPIRVDGPAVEPVTLSEMRAHLRLDHEAEDDLVTGLVKAARLMVEAASRRILMEQRWRLLLDRWPRDGVVTLPLAPVIAVDRVALIGAQGQESDLPPGAYDPDLLADPPRLVVAAPAPAPGRDRRGIVIDLRAGFGPAPEDVPAPLRLALKILVARWFENRGDIAGAQDLPPDALALIAPFQRPRL